MKARNEQLFGTLLGMLLVGGALSAEEQFYYIDPVLGADVVTGGSLESPWKTITYAVDQDLAPLTRLNLMPGVYSAASGETFPVELPSHVNVWGEAVCGAVIDMGGARAAFRVVVDPGGSAANTFAYFSIPSGQRGIEVSVGDGAHVSFLDVGDVRMTCDQPLAVFLGAGAWGNFSVGGSELAGSQSAVAFEAQAIGAGVGESVELRIAGSVLRAATGAAVRMVAADPAVTMRVQSVTTVFHDSPVGVELVASRGATLRADFEHCVFYGGGAGLTEAVGPGTARPPVFVGNSILWGHAGLADLPDYSAATYTLATNLVEDPGLVGIGGNIAGPPRFVDAAGGDWHLLPDSPARDAGSPVTVEHIFDADGDPAADWIGGDGLDDVGVDEFYPRYQWLHPAPAPGQVSGYRVLGSEGDAWLAFVGPISFFPGFGAGWQLHSLYLPTPFALGVIPAGGLAEASLLMPSSPALVGFRFMTQAVYATPPATVSFSANAHKSAFCD